MGDGRKVGEEKRGREAYETEERRGRRGVWKAKWDDPMDREGNATWVQHIGMRGDDHV